MADHRVRYKNSALDTKELRRRREEDSIQLRRQKRDVIVSKRRTLPEPELPNDSVESLEIKDEIETDETQEFQLTQDIKDALYQNTNDELLIAYAQKVRKALSKEPQPPFDLVIQSGLIPRFVQLLDRFDNTTIQFEVAWILTNICSGTTEQTRVVVEHNSVPKLVGLLGSHDPKVCEQAVWALGNIIGDGASFRDLVIANNFVPALLNIIRPNLEVGFLRNVTWVLVNLCRNKDPAPSLDVIKQLIPALVSLVRSTDPAVLIDTTWAISYITELGAAYAQLVIDSGLVSAITPLLSNSEIKLQTASIRALGTIVTGNEEQTQAVIDAGALPHLFSLLSRSQDRIIKEALWFLSNIAAGSTSQIQSIIDHQMIPCIISHLDKGEFHQQKEAAWTLYNMSLSATPDQLQVLIDNEVIPPLCNLLNLKDNDLIRNVLEILHILLNVCGENNPNLSVIIEECGGLDKIELLQCDSNREIYQFAYSIIEKYFSENQS